MLSFQIYPFCSGSNPWSSRNNDWIPLLGHKWAERIYNRMEYRESLLCNNNDHPLLRRRKAKDKRLKAID